MQKTTLILFLIAITALGCNSEDTKNNSVTTDAATAESDDKTSPPETDDTTPTPETGDKASPPETDDTTPTPETGDKASPPVKKTKVSFFITSEGSVKTTPTKDPHNPIVTGTRKGFSGGNLGGIAGADAQCTRLAEAAGLMGRDWKAFLFTSTQDPHERIGEGPWYNIDGAKIADDVAGLKAQNSTAEFLKLLKDEKGNNITEVTEHDILIGSTESNCNNWTSEDDDDEAGSVGHASTTRSDTDNDSNLWLTGDGHGGGRSGSCDPEGIKGPWGRGKFYCFACDSYP